MKITRGKKRRRYLNFFKNHFKFHAPFQVLVDSTFCHVALKNKVSIKDQVPNYLDDKVNLFTTSCVIKEAEFLGPKAHGAMLIVKQFKTQRCGHENDPISAAACLYSMVENGNMSHYILATMDPGLSQECRELLGVPLLYLNRSAMNLEKPSKFNTEAVELKNQQRCEVPNYQQQIIKKLKQDAFGEETVPQKKRKRAKGPNPLSCKKKKKKVKPAVAVETELENVVKPVERELENVIKPGETELENVIKPGETELENVVKPVVAVETELENVVKKKKKRFNRKKKKKVKPVVETVTPVKSVKKKRERPPKRNKEEYFNGFSLKFLEHHYFKLTGAPYPKSSTSQNM